MNRIGRTTSFALALAGLIAVSGGGAGAQDDAHKAELDALKASLMKYQDVYAAVREGYFSTVGCVHYSGEEMEGHVNYPKGAMGIHFINTSLVGPTVDPKKPPILIYEPVGNELKLVGLEWFVPLAANPTARPVLFGQEFQGPMEGHEPVLPKAFTHYDLHVWLFKDNPLGMFATTNPDVKCEGYVHELLESPTKILEHPSANVKAEAPK
jgi:hypothetical protein